MISNHHLIPILVVALLSACASDPDESDMPIVNDANCAPDAIKKITNKSVREKFASLCLRREPEFKHSEKKEW